MSVVHRRQLVPRSSTPLEQRMLAWVNRHGSASDVAAVAEALGVRVRPAWLAFAALLEAGEVRVEDGVIYPTRR